MCTYTTELLKVTGSAKGPEGWFSATDASVYVDHPVDFARGHALMIDVLAPAKGPSTRVALELDEATARALAAAILRTLDAVPEGLLDSE